MDDGDYGGISFDFEEFLDVGASNPPAPAPASFFRPDVAGAAFGGASNGEVVHGVPDQAAGNFRVRRGYRQTVCRHWLRGLCMKGEDCGFLHKYDKSRMPVCRFFKKQGECREQDCVFKHTTEEIKECNMYKLGFCPNGPYCRFRHIKLPGPPPPPEEMLRRVQQENLIKFSQYRNASYPRPAERQQFPQGPNGVNQGTTATEFQNMQQQGQEFQQLVGQIQVQDFQNAQQHQGDRSAITPPQEISRLVQNYRAFN